MKKIWCIKQCVLAIIFSSSFSYNPAEQIKKGVICVHILLEKHLTEHGRFHFQGQTTFYTPVLVTPNRHMISDWRWCDVMKSRRRQYDVISTSCACRQQCSICTVSVIYMQVYLHILVFNKCIQCTCKCTWLNIWEIATVFFWSPLQCEKELEQIIARTPFVMHKGTFRVERIFINDAFSLDFRAQNFPLIFP